MIYAAFLQVVLLAAILVALVLRHGPPPVSRASAQPLRGTAPERIRNQRGEAQVHLLLNGVHHSYRAEGHHDVLAIRRGEHPGFSIEGE